MRARNADWHARYTLPSLQRFFQPSRTNHGSYFWDWTTADEVAWRRFYGPFMRLINDYKNMGGRVTVGSDPGYIYQTWGFSYIQELEMLQEAGFSPLEVIQAATINGAREIYAPRGEEPPFGLVRPGMLADLVIVPGNPLDNLKLLYGTGHMRLNPETQQVERVGGVRWTIKDGIVYDARALLASVERMVDGGAGAGGRAVRPWIALRALVAASVATRWDAADGWPRAGRRRDGWGGAARPGSRRDRLGVDSNVGEYRFAGPVPRVYRCAGGPAHDALIAVRNCRTFTPLWAPGQPVVVSDQIILRLRSGTTGRPGTGSGCWSPPAWRPQFGRCGEAQAGPIVHPRPCAPPRPARGSSSAGRRRPRRRRSAARP